MAAWLGRGLLFPLALCLLSFPSLAFSVTAIVAATCLISATNLAFGAYTGALSSATSTVSVTCMNTSPYNIGLKCGNGGWRPRHHPDGDRSRRRYTDGRVSHGFLAVAA